MSLILPMKGARHASSAFEISSVFAGGEQGLWYQANDIDTLLQDSAGTTPVMAAAQLTNRKLDKSGNNNHSSNPGSEVAFIY
jgi:hypothetical protein